MSAIKRINYYNASLRIGMNVLTARGVNIKQLHAIYSSLINTTKITPSNQIHTRKGENKLNHRLQLIFLINCQHLVRVTICEIAYSEGI